MKADYYYNTQEPEVLTRDNKVFAYLKKRGTFIILQNNLIFKEKNYHLAFVIQSSEAQRKIRSDKDKRKSKKEVKRVVTYKMVHRIMAHPNLEVVSHITEAV